jgi:hypothetical protein
VEKMSRSGYSDDCDDNQLYLYRQAVDKAICGKIGQAFLKELARAMDEMPVKRLIHGELVSDQGEVCAIGVVCKKRNLDVSDLDIYDSNAVAKTVGIARALAAEIEYENDEGCSHNSENPEQRWNRVRKWVQEQIL